MNDQPTISQVLEMPALGGSEVSADTTADQPPGPNEIVSQSPQVPTSTEDLTAAAPEPEPAARNATPKPPAQESEAERAALFEAHDAELLRGRWSDVQAAFVDDPRQAVQAADQLVADLMARLAQRFADEKARLEADWGRDGEVSTEDLRVALQHYRAFFDRLLAL